jgi:RNA-directed DNA polymerase
MAVKLVIEPIFEADFADQAHGYRPERSAKDAVKKVYQHLCEGRRDVLDADLSSYFDTIPHDDLMKSVSQRVSDGTILELIKMWLEAPIVEEDDDGTEHIESPDGEGTPQGGIVSPLLANIYFNRFLKFWRQQNLAERLDARIVNYADDFVILTKSHAQQALEVTRWAMEAMGLTLNEDKTQIRDVDEESMEFLGYEFGWEYDRRDGHTYLAAQPSKESIKKARRHISEWLKEAITAQWQAVRNKLNQMLDGWANYFSYGTRTMAYRAIDNYVCDRVQSFMAKRHQLQSR